MEFRISLRAVFVIVMSFSGSVQALTKVNKTVPSNSLYQLQSTWTDQTGKNIKLNTFYGKKALFTMAYTACNASCPLVVHKLKAIEKQFLKKGFKDFHIVIASFDSDSESVDSFQKFIKKMKISSPRWHFIFSKSDVAVRELATVLNITYRKLSNSDFSHSNVMTLLDKRGVQLAQIEGLETSTDLFVDAFKKN